MTFEEWWETDNNPWKGADKLSEYNLAKASWISSEENIKNNICKTCKKKFNNITVIAKVRDVFHEF